MASLLSRLSHFYSWRLVEDGDIVDRMATLTACGHPGLVLGDRWCERLVRDPSFSTFLRQCLADSGCRFGGAHAPFRQNGGLDIFSIDQPGFDAHAALLAMLPSTFGIRTYTLHPGPAPRGTTVADHRGAIRRALERLLPAAERNGVVLALENGLQPTETPAEIRDHIEHFASPWLGCCYDVGHAHVTAAAPGKTLGDLAPETRALVGDGFRFHTQRALDALWPRVVVCHLHDNDGTADRHQLPGRGTVDWPRLVARLRAAPALVGIEDEAAPPETAAELCGLYDALLGGVGGTARAAAPLAEAVAP